MLHDAIHFVTHADKGIFYLVKMLALDPGRVAREYVHGRRKKFFSPLNFFLISVGLFVFVTATFKPMGTGNDLSAVKANVMKEPDVVKRQRQLLKLERSEKATAFVAKYSNIIRFIATPLFALLYFLFLRRSGYNFTEFLVAALYFSGFTALIFIFIITPFLLALSGWANFAGVMAYMVIETIYWSLGMNYFLIDRRKPKYGWILLLSIGITTFWFITSGFLMMTYINTGFGL
ncbi:DUF3667 domain-containing protein [Aridibaculum aurantiacum]|uniref:DUF3667 domain-containing protein n=1 Tax=Aridibaculum aurantiacum TaxID=2810307 RepID=UPI001A965EE2|nr:DUF3667 domain-containing protein [Aridibaculum aurantiacum]